MLTSKLNPELNNRTYQEELEHKLMKILKKLTSISTALHLIKLRSILISQIHNPPKRQKI